jgi:hypothetical protein
MPGCASARDATTPRNARSCWPASAMPSNRMSSSAVSARDGNAGSSAIGCGFAGASSAATAAEIASTSCSSRSISPRCAAPPPRRGANMSSMACARSAIARCFTTRAAPFSVCAKRSRRCTTSAAGAASSRNTSRPSASAMSRASMRK